MVLFNHGEHEFYVNPGDRIAQIVFAYMVDIQQ
jgi:dUTPase